MQIQTLQQTSKQLSLDIQNEDDNSYVCEACGFKLEANKCKLKCNRCGYFRSCSDLF